MDSLKSDILFSFFKQLEISPHSKAGKLKNNNN